ncbi:MAG: phosphomannomutase/phosphoglucomutase [Bacillota bacterium]|nr:phosphomannomutase/phosphoglucomutase [Bacillota bacterium]
MIQNIFRQYDIRGIVDQDLDDTVMKNIALAFASMAEEKGCKTILVGRDNRESSPRFRDLIIDTLIPAGFDVIDIGLVITPIFYYAAKTLQLEAGMMITASHNPGNYNGCKLWLGDSTIYGEEIQKLRKIAENPPSFTAPRGKLTEVNISNEYIKMIKEKITLGTRLPKLVVDCGNGSASFFAPQLFRELGCEVIELFCESDPRFPNHHPDPVDPKNMQDLSREVKATGADLGIGIDGDGDRLGVVDREGNLIWGDSLMILFWRDILPRFPGTPCIVEVKCSQSLIDEINRLGGKPIIYKTGHSLIKAKMKEINAIFTGEMSGHMFFADEYFGYDDALYAGARLIALLSKSDKDLVEMLSDVPRYYSTPEIRLPSSDEKKFTLVDQILKRFQQKYDVIDIDGARILFPNGWALVRASNTGPQLIFRCEGKTQQDLDEIKMLMEEALQDIGITVPAM